MRISTEQISRLFGATLNKVQKPAAKTASLTGARKLDHATFSAHAADVSEAQQLVAQSPDIRQDKIAEIRQRIADGTFEVSNERIADGIIAEARQDIAAEN
jgi:negative regulator of flagellin synthesis FlgM